MTRGAGGEAELLGELARRVEAGEEVLLATAVATRGSPPCRLGNKLLVGPGGPLAGTLGCSEFDAQAIERTAEVLRSGEPAFTTLTHDLGEVDAYLEPYRPMRRLVVVSATPVALHLLQGAPALGYSTVLVEDRPERVTAEHREAAGRVEPAASGLGSAAGLDAVATDHDAPGLAEVLATLLRAGAGHVGVMGSARHTGPHLEALRSMGITEADVARIHTPVGLDIGARSPGEIALSILAGLVADRAGRDGGFLHRRGVRASVGAPEPPAARRADPA